ncbi:MAG: lipid II:glycine glycyltransferase FemX [Oscillospiraceae bacterium]|jgi:peptidoglycan pentaglycine glycine transferase (the first glycine)
MDFILDTDPEEYDSFVRNHPTKSHFMQSPAWGEVCRLSRGMEYHLSSMKDSSGNIAAAALLLVKSNPVFPKYIYSPRGYVLDYSDKDLFGEFSGHVQNYAKSIGAMFVKIDPDVELREIIGNGETDPDGPDGTAVRDMILAAGYSPTRDVRVFGGRQPRYTFRIDLWRTESELRKRVRGNVMKNIRKGEEDYPCDIRIGGSEDVHHLYRLITLTSERDDFVGYSEDYYQTLYDTLAKYGMAKLYIGTAYPVKILESLKKKKDLTEKQLATYKKEYRINEAKLTLDRLSREIDTFASYAEKYPDGEVISAHFVVKYGRHEWAVHAGSAGIMNETFLNNRVYWKKIMDAKADGADWIDQFGTIGDPENSPLKSLHEFKKQFGGRYCEFVGEYDMVTRPFWYKLYSDMLPKVRRFRIGLKEAFRKKQ